MFKEKIRKMLNMEGSNKKKIENIAFLILALIVTLIVINYILKDEKNSSNENSTSTYKSLADTTNLDKSPETISLQEQLEKILTTIKGVGKVKVFLNYSESSKTVAMYDEKTTTSSTEETDSTGGLRNTTSTEVQKDVIYSQKDGSQVPMTEKVIMPTIEGAIITAQGAKDVNVKTNIVNAVKSATGLTIDKIQVFEMDYNN